MIIIIYAAVETILFFGCKQYSWPVSCTFRVLIGIHDFILFLVYAVLAVQGSDKYRVEYQYDYENHYNGHTNKCEDLTNFSACCCFLFTINFIVNV